MIFPWAFLFLIVPIPTLILNEITLPLQFLASNLGSSPLRLVGVPVLREGNVIQLPAITLEVVEALTVGPSVRSFQFSGFGSSWFLFVGHRGIA